jgi:hypothetical protein
MTVLALEAAWDWFFVSRNKTSVIFDAVMNTSLPLQYGFPLLHFDVGICTVIH